MRSRALAAAACGALAVALAALASLAYTYSRFLHAVEHAATEGGVAERPA